jgi:hypothetical protein
MPPLPVQTIWEFQFATGETHKQCAFTVYWHFGAGTFEPCSQLYHVAADAHGAVQACQDICVSWDSISFTVSHEGGGPQVELS